MDGDGSAEPRRRRRRRAARPQGAPPAAAVEIAAPPAAQPTAQAVEQTPGKPRRRRQSREAAAERGLRDIIGAGRSQVGVSGALRARDVNRPSAADLAEAERDVVIVKRNWRPPSEKP